MRCDRAAERTHHGTGGRLGLLDARPGRNPEVSSGSQQLAGRSESSRRRAPRRRSTVSFPSSPCCTDLASAVAAGSSRAGSSVKDSSVLPPRST